MTQILDIGESIFSFKIESDASDEILEELICLAKRASPVANAISRATQINPRLVN